MTKSNAATKPEFVARRVLPSDSIYGQIADFLTEEAYLLDDDKQHEWLALTTDDISYSSYLRRTLYREQGPDIRPGGEFADDKRTLGLRVRRNMDIPSAFDREPLPRICRVVGNFLVNTTEKSNEYAVRSKIILYRNRFDDITYDMLTATRDDIIRFTPEGLRLAKRVITPHMARLGAPFPNVFL